MNQNIQSRAVKAIEHGQFDFIAALAELVTLDPPPMPAQAEELFHLFLDRFLAGQLQPASQFEAALAAGIMID